jgi:hypothetical protein
MLPREEASREFGLPFIWIGVVHPMSGALKMIVLEEQRGDLETWTRLPPIGGGAVLFALTISGAKGILYSRPQSLRWLGAGAAFGRSLRILASNS